MYNYLFFDADGTLLDFNAAERRALLAMGEQEGFTFSEADLVCYQMANLWCWKQFERGEIALSELKLLRFERFNRESGHALDPERASARYETNLAQQGIMLDGARGVLTRLKELGYPLYLATNGIAEVQRGRIERAGIGHYFDGVFISEELGFQKPDPRYFEAMLTSVGLAAERHSCLMIGDSLSSDIRGGIASSIDTVWYNPAKDAEDAQITPTYTIRALDEVIGLLTEHR